MIAASRSQRWLFVGTAVVAMLQLATAQTPQTGPPQPPQAPFRAGVDLVSLNVTVSEGAGKYVTDLTAEDFNVFEDGVKQEVTFFNRTNLPIALAVLMDTSARSEEHTSELQSP